MQNGTRVVNARDDLFYIHNCCCNLFLLKHPLKAESSSNHVPKQKKMVVDKYHTPSPRK